MPEIVNVPGLSIKSTALPALVPSLVYVEDGQARQPIIGQIVRDRGFAYQHDNRLFRNFKRGIVAQPSPQPREIDGVFWGDREAGHTFLSGLIAGLPFAQAEVEQLVFTAPVAAFESYLSWLNSVMGGIATDHIYIVDESTAAALGYAVTEPGVSAIPSGIFGGSVPTSKMLTRKNACAAWLNPPISSSCAMLRKRSTVNSVAGSEEK